MTEFPRTAAAFIVGTRFDDLPPAVVHEAKRLILDSIGCAYLGKTRDAGKIGTALAQRLGGSPQSTIIGTPDKVSCGNAAFANSECMRSSMMDALVGLLHSPPVIIPSVLALAEANHVSGKDAIAATIVGLEFGSRLASARAPRSDAYERFKAEGRFDNDESFFKELGSGGYACDSVAAAAAAAKVMNLSEDATAYALCIGAYTCSPNGTMAQFDSSPAERYTPTGSVCQVGMTAALLAELGYRADLNVFDSEFGFWKFTNSTAWVPERFSERLGDDWQSVPASFNEIPMGICTGEAVKLCIEIFRENDLKPNDIERILLKTTPYVQFNIFRHNKLITPVDHCMNARYSIACAVHGVNPVHWQDEATRNNKEIKDFVRRLEYYGDYDEEEYWGAIFANKSPAHLTAEVKAKGQTFTKSHGCEWGICRPTVPSSDQALEAKFDDMTERHLSANRKKEIKQLVWDLDNLRDLEPLWRAIGADPSAA